MNHLNVLERLETHVNHLQNAKNVKQGGFNPK